jgi:hypothetical protein
MSNDPNKGWTAELVREHLQNAVYLELWTVPLYLTAAYSIVVPIDPTTNRPEMVNLENLPTNPDGSYDFDAFTQEQCNQYAFDSILSVAVQEMLHLELAANVANAVRPAQTITPDNTWVRFTDGATGQWAPNYDAPPPCLDAPLPAGVVLQLGPLNENQISLFQWVEEERAPQGDPQAYSPQYNSIGNFYTALAYGLQVCWPDLYPPQGLSLDPPPTPADLYQKDDWGEAVSKGVRRGSLPRLLGQRLRKLQSLRKTATSALESAGGYPFSIEVYGSSADAQAFAQAALLAISAQGEGAGPGEGVPTPYQPTTGDPIEIFLDSQSHWQRFTELGDQLVEKNRIQLITAQPSNDLSSFQMALYQSYSSFLVSLENMFSTQTPLGFEAMAGLGNRTLQVWEQGGTPDYKWDDPSQYQNPQGGFHACQGLDATGTCTCAYAYYHTCSTTNMCAGQGGCGFAVTNNSSDPGNWEPNHNGCQHKGGCGAPIPVGQVFNANPSSTLAPADLQNKGVWEQAREVMGFTEPMEPSELRQMLTPTSPHYPGQTKASE